MKNISRTQLLALRVCLLLLQQGKITRKPEGICLNVYLVYIHESYFIKPVLRAVTEEACKDWEHFSGRDMYPIDHPTQGPHEAYHSNGNLWDRRTKYGKRRHELVDRMLDVIDHQLSIRS